MKFHQKKRMSCWVVLMPMALALGLVACGKERHKRRWRKPERAQLHWNGMTNTAVFGVASILALQAGGTTGEKVGTPIVRR